MSRAARPLLYAGVVVVVFGLGLIHARWIGLYDFTGTSRFAWTVAYAVLLCVAAYAAGLPDVPVSRRRAFPQALAAAALGAGAMSVVQFAVGDALLPRFVVLGSAVVLVDWFGFCTGVAAGGRGGVAATAAEVAELRRELDDRPERPAVVVDAVDPSTPGSLGERARSAGATVVVLDREAQLDERVIAQAGELHEQGVRVRSLLGFYEEWLAKLPVSELERASLFFDIGELHRAGYVRARRVVDVSLALVGAVALAVLVPVVLVANLGGNRGPLFYRQERVGKGGVAFRILKFRTMVPDAGPAAVGRWTEADDPRVTRFGRILRRSHLDELPQVLNVLRGDLAVVGPRPEQPAYVAELEAKLPFYRLRHLVRPGLTGWAQVKYGYAGNEDDALEKLQYEFWYLRHQGVGTDMRIVGRTIRSVLGGEGAGR